MPPVPWLLLADLVVVLHLAFVAFVVAGGLAVWRWPRAAWLHLPAAAWGAGIEWAGAVCPLTPVENYLRSLGGAGTYQGDFVREYLLPVLYPAGLTRPTQVALGVFVVAVNAVVYGWWLYRRRTP